MEDVSDGVGKEIFSFRNDLLKRREIKLVIEAGSNPGFKEAGKKVSEAGKVNEDLVFVRGVKSKFGRGTFLIDAFIYDSKEDMEKAGVKKAEESGEREDVSEESQSVGSGGANVGEEGSSDGKVEEKAAGGKDEGGGS